MAKLLGAKNREVKPVCEAQEGNSLKSAQVRVVMKRVSSLVTYSVCTASTRRRKVGVLK